MDHSAHLTAASIVSEVMAGWPQTIEVFLDHRMACVGCAMARFCTMAEATRAYHMDTVSFVHELERAMLQPPLSE
jgi:hybrid cluster-associated redox disulfide protein